MPRQLANRKWKWTSASRGDAGGEPPDLGAGWSHIFGDGRRQWPLMCSRRSRSTARAIASRRTLPTRRTRRSGTSISRLSSGRPRRRWESVRGSRSSPTSLADGSLTPTSSSSSFLASASSCGRRKGRSRCLRGIADRPGNPVAAVHLLDRSHVLVVDVESEDVGVLPNAVGVRALRQHWVPLLDGPAQ